MKKLITLVTTVLTAACLFAGCGNSGKKLTAEEATAKASAVFTIDVNPEIEVKVDDEEKVIQVNAENEDAVKVLGKMDLEGANVDVALNAIIGSMYVNGYIGENSNSVLVSFSKSENEELVGAITDSINTAFETAGVHASIIEQHIEDVDTEVREELEHISEQYNISEGKAKLIKEICDEYPALSEEELAALKINDLNLLLQSLSKTAQDHFDKIGAGASETSYIGELKAFSIATADAKVAETDITGSYSYFTRFEGKMAYSVTFTTSQYEYHYIIEAKEGAILSARYTQLCDFNIHAELNKYYKAHAKEVEAWLKNHPDRVIVGSDAEEVAEIINQVGGLVNNILGSVLGGGNNGHNNNEHANNDHDNSEHDNNEHANNEHVNNGNGNNNQNVDAGYNNHSVGEAVLKHSQILSDTLKSLGIDRKQLKDTKVSLMEEEGSYVFRIEIVLKDDSVYNIYAEAGTGIIVGATLNGNDITVEQ